MILAIDVGNTNINIAVMGKKAVIRKRFSLPAGNTGGLGRLFSRIKKKYRIDKGVMVSVVPSAVSRIKGIFKKNFKDTTLLIAGNNVRVPLKCDYDRRQVGQDRLITAFAARALYGLPVLIVDFGTAVTFDAVSAKGVYIGGLILPGIKMSLESLAEKAALLPHTYLKKTASFIGRDTVSSIRAGMVYGYASLCDGLIARFKKKVKRNIKVVATGGDAYLISRYAKSMKKIDKDLSLKGLYILSETRNRL